MSQDEFTKLFVYMSKRFDDIDAKLDAKADKVDLDKIYTHLDGILKRLDDDDAERAAIITQLDRHEGWIHQLAAKTAAKLS